MIERSKKDQYRQTHIHRNPTRGTLIVWFATLSYVFLHLAALAIPIPLWGTDFSLYHSLWVNASAAAILCLVLIAGSQKKTAIAIEVLTRRIGQWLYGSGLANTAIKLGLLGFLLSLTWLFRVRLHTLGDSALRIGDLDRLLDIKGSLIAHIMTNSSLNSELLDLLIHFFIYRWGKDHIGLTAGETYAYISCLAGAGYAIITWLISRHLGRTSLSRIGCAACCLTLGTVQLFFGYAESYTLVTLAGALYVFLALRTLSGAPVAPAAFCLLIAIALHAMALALLPSLCYLLWIRFGRPGCSHLQHRSVQLVLIGGGLIIGLYGYLNFYPLPLPLWSPLEEGRYAMFSWRHALLLINATMLVSPFGLVWVLIATLRKQACDTITVFLAWSTLGTGTLIFCHDAYLGGRDWDLLSFPGFFAVLWGLSCLRLIKDGPVLRRQLRLVIVPVMTCHTLLWIGVNSDPDRALIRLENLLLDNNNALHYRHFALGYHYSTRGKPYLELSESHYRKAIAATKDSSGRYEDQVQRYRKRLGSLLVSLERFEEAIATFDSAYAQHPNRIAYEQDLFFLKKRTIAFIESGNKKHKAQHYEEANARWKRAVECTEHILAVEESALTYRQLGVLREILGEYSAATIALVESVKIETEAGIKAETYVSLARNLERLGHTEAARKAMEQAVNLAPDRQDLRDRLEAMSMQTER